MICSIKNNILADIIIIIISFRSRNIKSQELHHCTHTNRCPYNGDQDYILVGCVPSSALSYHRGTHLLVRGPTSRGCSLSCLLYFQLDSELPTAFLVDLFRLAVARLGVGLPRLGEGCPTLATSLFCVGSLDSIIEGDQAVAI